MKREPIKKIIMIMGIQRSGGTTLIKSWMGDERFHFIRHGRDERFFYHRQAFLRPEAELRDMIQAMEKTLVIEPKSETKIRDVSQVFEEYGAYDLKVIWIYRNPVSVFQSRIERYPDRDWMRDEARFIELWNDRQRRLLEALPRFRERIVIVRLEDLVRDPGVYQKLSRSLGLRGVYGFYKNGQNKLMISPQISSRIKDETLPTLAQLDQARSFKPQMSPFLGTLNRYRFYLANKVVSLKRRVI